MIKSKLRATLSNTLAQIDETGKWHDTYLDHIIEVCINSLVYEAHATDPRALGQYTKRYQAQYLSAGLFGRYAYTLTVKLIPLPDKRGGVRSIVATEDPDLYFVPVTDQELLLMDGSQAQALTTTTPIVAYFAVRPDMIEFSGLSATELYYTYTFDLLVAFTSLSDTDNVPLPYGKEREVIVRAIEILGLKPPRDLLDNNSDIR